MKPEIVEHIFGGSYICKEKQAFMGLYVIKKGYVTVISPHHNGGLVTLGPGSYFGELNLIFENQSSVVVRSMTNCEMWVLHKFEFKRLVRYLPQAVMRQLKTNYFNILKTKDCGYHNNLTVKRPKNFLAMVSSYQRHGEISSAAARLLLQEAITTNRSTQNLRQGRAVTLLLHQDMKFLKAWRFIICILSVTAFLELLRDKGTYEVHQYTTAAGLMDCLWPSNPYTMVHVPDLPKDEALEKASMSFSFILSVIFLFDFIISFITVDKVVFSFISKKELLMKKLAFQNEGVNTLIDAMSIFLTALKLYNVTKILPCKRARNTIHLTVLFCILIAIVLYTTRLSYYFAYHDWTKGSNHDQERPKFNYEVKSKLLFHSSLILGSDLSNSKGPMTYASRGVVYV